MGGVFLRGVREEVNLPPGGGGLENSGERKKGGNAESKKRRSEEGEVLSTLEPSGSAD